MNTFSFSLPCTWMTILDCLFYALTAHLETFQWNIWLDWKLHDCINLSTKFEYVFCLMCENKEFLAIRRAISLNKTFVLFCGNNDWRHKAHSTNTYRRAVYVPLPASSYI